MSIINNKKDSEYYLKNHTTTESKIMENNTIQWGWEEGKPSNMRSKEHQEFLIKEYNKNRPKENHVKNMAELNRALLDLPLKDTEEWLENNESKWEQALDNKFNDATLEYGLGLDNPLCDGMNESMADRETRYDVNGEKYGGHV